MQKISFDQIKKTYNGRVGCACGCNGDYTLPSHISIDAANAETGWKAYNEDNVSDRRAKIALSKINKAIDKYGPQATLDELGEYCEYFGVNEDANRVWFCYSKNFVAIDIGNRATTVYFAK